MDFIDESYTQYSFEPDYIFEKNCAVTYAFFGDILTYNIKVKCSGNTNFKNIIIEDTIFKYARLIDDSLKVNNVITPNEQTDPELSNSIKVTLTNSSNLDEFNISYNIQINYFDKADPTPQSINTVATGNFIFIDSSNNEEKSVTTSSTILTTKFNYAYLDVKKSAPTYVDLGTDLVYSISIKNLGTVSSESLTLKEVIPPEATYKPRSLLIDEKTYSDNFEWDNITLKNLVPNQSIDIRYILTIPEALAETITENYIFSASVFEYSYLFNPETNTIKTVSSGSNMIHSYIRYTKINTLMEVDKPSATIGDQLTYTIKVTNTGHILARSVRLKTLNIPSSELVAGSIKINGYQNPQLLDLTNLNLNNIKSKSTKTIEFTVTVTKLPPNSILSASCSTSYKYLVDPDTPLKEVARKTSDSNVSDTRINDLTSPTLSISSDKYYIKSSDIAQYSILFNNTSSRTLNTIKITNSIPKYCTLLLSSISINYPKTNDIINNSTEDSISITINNVPPNTQIQISYTVNINVSDLSIQTILNTVSASFSYYFAPQNSLSLTSENTLFIRHGKLLIIKRADSIEKLISETIDFTIIVNNLGNVLASNIKVYDYLIDNLTFVANSIKIDGASTISQQLENLNIGELLPNTSKTIEFKAIVNSKPISGEITNYASVNYEYIIDENKNIKDIKSENSDTIIISVLDSKNIIFNKSVDKDTAYGNDELVYTLTISNKKTVDINNIKIIDTIPLMSTLIKDSVTIDDTPFTTASDVLNVSRDLLSSNQITTLKYRVLINSNTNNIQTISNDAYVSYTFINNTSDSIPESLISNQAITTIRRRPSLTLNYKVNKKLAFYGDTLLYTLSIENTSNIILNNIIVAGQFPKNTSLVPLSIYLNGSFYPSPNQQSLYISIGLLKIGEKADVSFKVVIDNYFDSFNSITSALSVSYDLTINGLFTQPIQQTDTITTSLTKYPLASLTKRVDKRTSLQGDKLTYSLEFTNTTGKILSLLNIIDTIPKNCVLIPNSVFLNQQQAPDLDNVINRPFGNIPLDYKLTFTYSVLIEKTSNFYASVINNAYCSYKFNESDTDLISLTTEDVQTTINYTKLNITLSGEASAILYDTINYRIQLENLGDVKILSSHISIPIPEDLSIDVDSIHGQIIENSNISNSTLTINLKSISPKYIDIISFNAKVIDIPFDSSFIALFASIYYKYEIAPSIGSDLFEQLQSNEILTSISPLPEPIFTKKSNTNYGNGDTEFQYTITFNNTDRLLEKVEIIDNVENGFYIVPNSLFLNNVPKPFTDNNIKISIDNPILDNLNIITYKVGINPYNTISPILYNEATALYTFKNHPSETFIIKTLPNIVYINHAQILILKSVDKTVAYRNDIIKYTIEVQNIGNVPTTDAYIVDQLDDALILNSDSIFLNGLKSTSTTLDKISFANLDVSIVNTIKYTATVKSTATPKLISTSARVYFKYNFDPTAPDTGTIDASINSMPVTTEILPGGLIEFNKSANKEYASTGDELIYTIELTNRSSNTINTISIIDTIPAALELIPGSQQSSNDAPVSISRRALKLFVPFLSPDNTINLSYKVNVKRYPPLRTNIKNTAYCNYDSIVASSKFILNIREADLLLTQTVNKDSAKVNDLLTYTIVLVNNGNVAANDVYLTDILPVELQLLPESIKINPEPVEKATTLSNLYIGNIEAKESVSISFNAQITDVPPSGNIENFARVQYTYIKDLTDNIPIPKTSTSIKTTTKIMLYPNVAILQTVDKTFADLDDLLTYTITIRNNNDFAILQSSILNTLSTNLEFVPGSVTLNNIPLNIDSLFPSIQINDLAANSESFISFKVKIVMRNNIIIPEVKNTPALTYTFIDSTNPENQRTISAKPSTTTINNVTLTISKTSKNSIVTIGDIKKYTIEINNIGSTIAKNVILKDILPSSLTLDKTSITINNVVASNVDLSLLNLDKILPQSRKIITFKATVSSLPSDNTNTILNTCNVEYDYIANPTLGISKNKVLSSNTDISTIGTPPDVTIITTVNTLYASKGDNLIYTIKITNNSKEQLVNNYLLDYIPDNTKFMSNSLVLNGDFVSIDYKIDDFKLPDLIPGKIITISYAVNINMDLSKFNEISNSPSLKYSFLNNLNNTQTIIITSPPVTTSVNGLILDVTKTVDTTTAFSGDILTYNILITNKGNTDAIYIYFTENIPVDAMLVSDSIKIDNVGYYLPDLNNFSLGRLAPAKSIEITFKSQIKENPTSTSISSVTNINYEYLISPDELRNRRSSVTATTQISTEATVILNKNVDNLFCTDNDELTYHLEIKNKTNSQVYSLNIVDTLPSLTNYVPNSLQVDGHNPNINDNTIDLAFDNIAPNKIINIYYKALYKNANPQINELIVNSASGNYQLTENSPPISITSNEAETLAQSAILKIERIFNKLAVRLNDIIICSISISNLGNTDAYDIIISDDILQSHEFVENSLKIDNITKVIDSLSIINIPVIKPKAKTTILFSVKIIEAPIDNKIVSKATVNYSFSVSPIRTIDSFVDSNETELMLDSSSLITITKFVEKKSISKSEELFYSIKIKNENSTRVTNINIIDSIPNCTTLKDNSVYLDYSPITTTGNIIDVTIDFLDPNQESTIVYSVLTNECNLGSISNDATARFKYFNESGVLAEKIITSNKTISYISSPEINAVLTASKFSGTLGDTVDFIITIANSGNKIAYNVFLLEDLPDSLELIKNSLSINKRPILGTPALSRIALGNIGPKQTLAITFTVKIIKVPTSGRIENIAGLIYSYSRPDSPVAIYSSDKSVIEATSVDIVNINDVNLFDKYVINDGSSSNEININIENISPNVIFEKSVDKIIASNNEILTYTLNLKNTGNVVISNITIIDTLPQNITLIEDSFKVDNLQAPSILKFPGFRIIELQPNKNISLTFDVRINDNNNYISSILNTAYLQYTTSNSSLEPVKVNATSNQVLTEIRHNSTPENLFSYAQYTLIDTINAYKCNKLPLYKISINGDNISNTGDTINLAKDCSFNVKFSVVLKTEVGSNRFKAGLTLNNNLVPGSTITEKNYIKKPKSTTLNCSVIVKTTTSDNNYLNLIYCAYSNKPISILSASLTIIESK